MTVSIMPHLVVHDGEAALKFYEKAFGAIVEQKVPAQDGKRLMHAHLKLNGGDLLLVDDFPEHDQSTSTKAPKRLGGTAVVLHLEVPDADAAFERALKAGASVVMPLDNMFWGARYGKLKDPFGHIWSIGGPLKT
jgi:PhnB protein